MTWIYFWLNIKMCANCVKMLDLLPQRQDWAIIIIQDTNTNPIISLSWPDIISHCCNFSIIGRRHFLCRTQSARRQYDHHPCTCTHRCTLPSLVAGYEQWGCTLVQLVHITQCTAHLLRGLTSEWLMLFTMSLCENFCYCASEGEN